MRYMRFASFCRFCPKQYAAGFRQICGSRPLQVPPHVRRTSHSRTVWDLYIVLARIKARISRVIHQLHEIFGSSFGRLSALGLRSRATSCAACSRPSFECRGRGARVSLSTLSPSRLVSSLGSRQMTSGDLSVTSDSIAIGECM